MKELTAELLDLIEKTASSKKFRSWIADCLHALAGVDGTPHPEPALTARNERKAFDLIESQIKSIPGLTAAPRFIPIDPAIEKHPFYTQPHYTKTAERPQGLGVRETYAGRGNLVLIVPGARRGKSATSLAVNSHIDTVAPHIAPRLKGDVVFGRGACDAKGQVVSMLAQLRLLAEARRQLGVVPQGDVQFQFVIEEEPGGNGSLSLALQDPHPYDVILVCEATQLKIHPANRGAVWYKTQINCGPDKRLNPVEMAACVVLALEEEGAKIKGESDHPLFPTRPVQTNHGILGPYGSHPSAVRHLARLWIGADGGAESALLQAVEKAVGDYCARYGDKTKETDAASGKAKVDHHYDLISAKGGKGFVLAVHGKAGHMGAVLECDGAITKTAYIVRELMKLSAEGLKLSLAMADPDKDGPWAAAKAPARELILEGGQGFLPTHDIFEVQKRLVKAAASGAKAYCRKAGAAWKEAMVKTTFDKLHNDAFARRPDSPAMKAALYAARQAAVAGVWKKEPVVGWNVSCDARIFAKQFPKREVITFGPGSLAYAHSPQEQLHVGEAAAAARMMAVYTLALCGWEKVK